MGHTKCSNPMMCKCLCRACDEAYGALVKSLGDQHFEHHCAALLKEKRYLALTHDEAENLQLPTVALRLNSTTNSCTRDPAESKFAVGELVLKKNHEPVVVNAVSSIDGRHVYSVTAIRASISDVSRLASVSVRSIYEEALIKANLGDYKEVISLLLDARRRILDCAASVNAEYAAFRAQAESEIRRLRRLLEQKPTNGRPQRCVTIETDHGWDD